MTGEARAGATSATATPTTAAPGAAPALAAGPWPASALDTPYDRLAVLPRALWLPGLVCSAGGRAARLADARCWLDALGAGLLPPPAADFGDAQACRGLREAVGDLGLPALCRGVAPLAEQVLRTLLWHLDRIVDHQPRQDRATAIATVTAEFRAAWTLQTQGLEDALSLLQGLVGDLARLRWDTLSGHLNSRPWAAARRAAERLQRLPELAALIDRLGRSARCPEADAARPPPLPEATPRPPLPWRLVHTRLPDAPGEITGIRHTDRPERMLASEAVMLRHPVLKKLWRARHAEARLLGWQTEAVLADWRPDPHAANAQGATDAPPEALARGPILVCLDTSGSMRGAPEQIAKAVVIAALRAAHAAGRGCRLIAFGGPGELLERDLDQGEAGLQALLDLMGQAFDGGTDIQTPIERAVDTVHQARWRSADLLLVTDGEFGCVPATLARLDEARARLGLRVQGVLVGDRETLGLMETCDHIHWVRDWRRHADAAQAASADSAGRAGHAAGMAGAAARSPAADAGGGPGGPGFSPVHSKSLTALYFPNALSARAARHQVPR